MAELAEELLRGEDAWVVGGAVRDELLGRPVLDLDIACREPERAARAYGARSGGAVFPLSVHHGGWRVALDERRTVDFLPLQGGSIEADLGTRDFAINAIAVPLAGGEAIDPYHGQADLERGLVRVVSPRVFDDDPLRLLRAVRMEDELDFRLDTEAEALVREGAPLVTQSAGERVLDELRRLSAGGYERLAELGLLEPLGGSLSPRLREFDSPEYRLAVTFGARLRAAADLERAPPVHGHAAPGGGAGGRLAARDPPLPPGDRAVGARGAGLPGRRGARRCGPGRPRARACPAAPSR